MSNVLFGDPSISEVLWVNAVPNNLWCNARQDRHDWDDRQTCPRNVILAERELIGNGIRDTDDSLEITSRNALALLLNVEDGIVALGVCCVKPRVDRVLNKAQTGSTVDAERGSSVCEVLRRYFHQCVRHAVRLLER